MHWALFCRVIDNYGDLGVAWRLASQIAASGDTVQLWVDAPEALAWMAPGALEGRWPRLQVRPWTQPFAADALAQGAADVWVELFGCDIDPEFIAQHDRFTPASGAKSKATLNKFPRWRAPGRGMGCEAQTAAIAAAMARIGNDADRPQPGCATREGLVQRCPKNNPVWINLEYLSAEAYVERSHGLPSPILHGPARGRTRHFFFPGYTERTGGLLREPDLLARQVAFDAARWRERQRLPSGRALRISLFCYEPPALGAWLDALAAGGSGTGQPVQLWVTHGRAAAAVRGHFCAGNPVTPLQNGAQALQVSYLPALTQTDYDHLLWAADLNFVRGEDSLVRALWAGKPFIWNIYPQDDGAHAAKLEALLDWLDAPPSLRRFHRIWNGLSSGALPPPDLALWGACIRAARERLLTQPDLLSQLRAFVADRRQQLQEQP
ncbi:putative repeat protein (TIGR03837 family) [Tibeticola sediminis]|uniref:Protein-arginine rhamnosyltransferase n=2 Tax=Tibeticola sediminis TaxID=1917811 RepID=A0A3N4UPV5_9BURK|nr:putative repeat protein (TIGR03837 family) [Tibeticola sediminis]